MARKKGSSTTVEVTHEILEPYYLSVDSENFSVHKRIPSGHKLAAKGHFSTLPGALRNIAKLKAIDLSLEQEGGVDLAAFIALYYDSHKVLADALQELTQMVDAFK